MIVKITLYPHQSDNFDAEVRDDEAAFHVRLVPLESESCEGYAVFEVAGEANDVQAYLDHYDLEPNDE